MGDAETSRRMEALASLLVDAAPLLRSRIRARRGTRMPHLGTSDIYASVVRRAISIERSEGIDALADTDPNKDDGGKGREQDPPAPRASGASRLWKLMNVLVDRVLIDAKRRERVERRIVRTRAASGASTESTPHDSALVAEDRTRARHLIEQLDEADRELLYLRLSGREWADVAAALGISPEAARQRWHRLANTVAQALDPEVRP